ncbi:MAG: hypothetical protein LKK19_05980 [Bacteroidales bacterium]|nr:hypothetical protein [Bacteroidales bacterium]MCI2122235.1 hypothetical protein [Bacteroidales bacterium]MCI2144795.1 hypothetical protein [Bacteroidales bacterium]
MNRKDVAKGILMYTVFAALVAVISIAVFRFWIPKYYFRLYPLIPVYFYVTGMVQFLIVSKAKARKPKSWTNIFFAAKSVKLIVALAVAVLYCFAHKDIAMAVLISTGAVYLLVLAFETWFYYSYGKKEV